MAALGEALPPTARSGLMLFLRRGMWGWAQTLAAASPVQQPVRIASLHQCRVTSAQLSFTCSRQWR